VGVTHYLGPQPEYEVPPRRISGDRDEKLEQIDAAIQELLDIKVLECASDQPNVRFLAVPRPRPHPFAVIVMIVVLLAMLALLLGARTAQAQTNVNQPPAPPLAWQYGGFADIGYLWDDNHPANHVFRSRGTAWHVDEWDLNVAGAYLRKKPSPASRWGAELGIQAGRDTEIFGFSATAPNMPGADVLRHFGPTNVSYLLPAGRGLTVQGGIFASLIGYDSLYAKDNLTYTRPWGGDFTPYFMLGANVGYPFTERLTGTFFVVNGYWHLADANDVPSSGVQLAYSATPNVTIKQTAFWGPHQSDTAFKYWRFLSDTIVERRRTRATVAGEYQVASERVAGTSERALWMSAQVPMRWQVHGPVTLAARPEWAWDRDGRWTLARQHVTALALTADYKVLSGWTTGIIRLEYRIDDSRGPDGGFFKGPDNSLTPGQNLLIVGFLLNVDRGSGVTP
jgi:Putative beta-barrel porin-2, OmpL-like. bbp2